MKAIWSIKGYILLGLISYVLFVVLTAPLGFIWPKIQPKLGPLPVQVISVDGTLWQGQVQLQAPQVGLISAQWDIQISDLLVGQLTARIEANGDELKFSGLVSSNGEQVEITDSEAFMSSRYLKPLLRQGRASLEGSFELNNFNSLFSLSDKQIKTIQGRLLYSGGDVSFPIDGRNISARLPILVGDITKPNDNVDLEIRDTEGNSIGSGYIQPDGWAGIVIRRRLLDMLGQKWPADVTEDAVIFEVSQKLL